MSQPKLRFPEFTDEWQPALLEDIASFSKGASISKDDISPKGATLAIRYGELYTTYSEVIDTVKSSTNLPVDSLVLSKQNDVIIPASGETHIDIATASCVLRDGIALSGDINIIRSNQNGVFLAYYLNKKRIDIARRAQGVSVIHLYSANLKDLSLNLPSIPEQQKIADLLMTVDKKIETIDKKVELLKQYKKSVMQKIFSQQIRFKDVNGNNYSGWKSKKLVDVFDRVTTKNKKNNQNILTISAQQGLVSQADYFNKLVAAKDVTNYYLLQRDDFAYNKSYSAGYPMGAIKRLKHYDEGVVSTLYICFRAKNSCDIDFFEHVFDFGLQNAEIEKVAQEGARNHGLLNIGVDDFFNIEMRVPADSQEHQKIADFLSAIDAKIKAEETKLASAKKLKKALLQRMFI